MPLGKHFCSGGLGMKLASLMSAPEAHNITTMDKLTSSELIRLILQESPPANSEELGHVLLLTFKSCTTEVPKAKDLKVPLKKIHPDTRIEAFQQVQNEATLVPLYNTQAHCWNWPLPDSHLDKLTRRKSKQAGEKSSMNQEEREGENSGTMNEKSGDWVFVNDTGAPTASESQAESVGQPEDDKMSINSRSSSVQHGTNSGDRTPVLREVVHNNTKPWMTKQIFASFYNILSFTLLLQQPALAQKHNLSHVWSASNSSCPTTKAIQDAQIVDSETAQIEETVSKPAIEDTVPSPAANIPLSMVLPIEEVPKDPLYLIFSTQGLIGHGTTCYLVRKDEEEYIIKDHWVLGGKSEVLNEICMMEKMDGICGVPCLVEYWLVEMEPSEVDETVKYHQKVLHSIQGTSCTHVCLVLKPCVQPLYQFRSHTEFLTVIWDILKIQKLAVEQNRVLHHDCSLNNAMIGDDGNGSHGMSIDWEFAERLHETINMVSGAQAQYLSCRDRFSSSFTSTHWVHWMSAWVHEP
ncbi:uncharacterized protein EDB91DRAFT_1256195 [Suillus paluster]|uniref:uncharacterized protein n=1 Tax=Suillus paluster TaxID=48578 RepID=UPI001B867C6B|nr:uncharacterized protein EDB91DRAFT_1256195 [Suillus paluster]KAG1722132.1 hypothetical protein EDB91DRAFT_1256195 [Suillus paluster]